MTGALSVSGSYRSSYTMRESAGTYNIAASSSVVIFNNGSTHTAVLPPINDVNKGLQLYVKNIGSGDVTVTGSLLSVAGNEQFIDGLQTLTVTQGESAKLMGFQLQTGFEWAILSFRDV